MSKQSPDVLFQNAVHAFQAGHHAEAQNGLKKLQKLFPGDFDVLNMMGHSLLLQGKHTQAVRWLGQAVSIKSDVDALYHLGMALRLSEQPEKATRAYQRVLEIQPDHLNSHLSLVEIKYPGEHYTKVLHKLHRFLKPANYIEIGVETGQSMALAMAETQCIGIDPQPKITAELPPRCEIFSTTSDAFFEHNDLAQLFNQKPVEFAFIDGLHEFDAALRDFINLERHATSNTVIAIHDCAPLDAATSTRERLTNFWSGDVWKTILCLKKYRPELQLATVAAKPTGLGLITGLDPGNCSLKNHYQQIVDEFMPLTFDDISAVENEALNMIPNDMNLVLEFISSHQLKASA